MSEDPRVEPVAQYLVEHSGDWMADARWEDLNAEEYELAYGEARELLAAADAVEGQDRPEDSDVHWVAMAQAEMDRVEAERDLLREALERIASMDKRGSNVESNTEVRMRVEARAALAGSVSDKDREPDCPRCNGSGLVPGTTWHCSRCRGDGHLRSGDNLG